MPSMQAIADVDTQEVGFRAAVKTDLREQMHNAVLQATEEVFQNDIVPEAKSGSPVRTGKNRDSIAVSFRDRLESSWVSAWIFTQSGYGWLIEHGTSHNRKLTKTAIKKRNGKSAASDRTPAVPYIYPAITRFISKIATRAKELMESNNV